MRPKLSKHIPQIGGDYQNLCRLCLKKTSFKIDIYQEEGLLRNISKKILNCLSITVTEDDSSAKFVCLTCTDKLDNFQNFRDMCHESENLLTIHVSALEEFDSGIQHHKAPSVTASSPNKVTRKMLHNLEYDQSVQPQKLAPGIVNCPVRTEPHDVDQKFPLLETIGDTSRSKQLTVVKYEPGEEQPYTLGGNSSQPFLQTDSGTSAFEPQESECLDPSNGGAQSALEESDDEMVLIEPEEVMRSELEIENEGLAIVEDKVSCRIEISQNKFFIIKFLDEDGALDIVPSNWITSSGRECFFPNMVTYRRRKMLVKEQTKARETWPAFPMKVLCSYDTYAEARFNLRTVDETSHLAMEDIPGCQKRKLIEMNLPGEEDVQKDPPAKIKKKNPGFPFSYFPTVHSVQPSHEQVSKLLSKSTSNGHSLLVPSSTPVATCIPSSTVLCTDNQTSRSHVQPASYLSPSFADNSSSDSGFSMSSRQWDIMQQWMANLSEGVRNLERKVDMLVASQGLHSREEEDPEEDLVSLGILPLKNYDDFMTLESRLKESRNLKSKLVQVLISTGGRNMRALIHNMLRCTLDDCLAQNFNLTGKSTKKLDRKPFIGTEISRILFYACQKVYENITEDKLRECIGDWLHQAKTRLIRREIKLKAHMHTDSNDEESA